LSEIPNAIGDHVVAIGQGRSGGDDQPVTTCGVASQALLRRFRLTSNPQNGTIGLKKTKKRDPETAPISSIP